ncbi:hypothetical protein cypCar_00030125 [Cyprinus carpio]|nr:hypothetical protein cypCar_00030125 [Cyprinus carpio]
MSACYSQTCAAAQENKNVFSDGVTRIDIIVNVLTDFVLVWEESVNPLKSAESDEVSSSSSRDTHRKWRTEFLSRLRTAGLHQETAVTTPISIWSEKILEKLHIPNIMAQDVPNLPPDYYTCQFRSNKLERFLGHENKDTFFKTTQRHQILYEILARTPYGSLKRGEVGIGRLVSEHVLTAAFPLHEGPFEMPKTPVDPQSLNMRQILHHYWARWACWRKYQPLDHIREYFGEKIALYFAWLGFYTGWLLPAAVVGFIIFLFGIWLMVTDVAAEELCTSGDTFVMCPLCNICRYWNLSSICYTYKAGLLFDNGGTVFFSIFMSLWAVTFLEYWKRTSSILSHRWDCSEFEEIEERPRPEFTALAPMTVRNPVTGAEEPYFPETQRLSRTLTGNMVIILMIAIVLIFLIAIILYRTILSIIIYRSQNGFFIFSVSFFLFLVIPDQII